MLAESRDDLICDLAETYGILDMESLPVKTLAVLSFGLRDDSRIKTRLSGMKSSLDRLMLAGCFDALSWIRWSKTEDAQKGGQPPRSMCRILCGMEIDVADTEGYETVEDFIAARERIIKEAQNGH